MDDEATPEQVDETPTVPVAPMTNRELVFGEGAEDEEAGR